MIPGGWTDLTDLGKAICDCSEGVFLIDTQKGRYTTVRKTASLPDSIKEQGSLEDLCWQLIFSSEGADQDSSNTWKQFTTISLSEGRFFTRRITITNGDQNNLFYFSFYPLPDQPCGYIVITSPSMKADYDMMRLESQNAINEAYLYSMNVDLEADQCLNPYVTEIALPGQTYPDLGYLKWRTMVLDSFSPENQDLFLSRTAPGYIASRLTAIHDSFSFDIQMQTISRKRIWTKHTLYRIMNYSSSHLMLLYTVMDIHEEKTKMLQRIRDLEEHLLYDSLTLTYNSKTMQELVSEASVNASEKHPCSLIYVSLKPDAVNRTAFYNTQNDDLLIDLADFLKKNLPSDAAIAHSRHTAFVCMCPDTPVDRAEKTAQALLKAYRKDLGQNHPQICLGVGVLPITPQENLDQIRRRLDLIGIAVMQKEGNIALNEEQVPQLERKERNSDIILNRIEDDIRQNYSRKLTLRSLGEKHFINSAYLGQLFIQRHNMTFSEYLWQVRLTQAAWELANTDKYIYEILADVGATNANYFKKLFISRYGMTPTQYRKQKRA